jgi:hypothetical protein
MCHSNEIESEHREFRENTLSSVISAFFQKCGFREDAQLIRNSHIEHESSMTGKPAIMSSVMPHERREPLLRKPQALSAKSRHSII